MDKSLGEFLGKTHIMDENTALEGLLNDHMAPVGKYGLLVVTEGSCDYKWNDSDTIYTIKAGEEFWIEPERLHKVIITGPVKFRVEFYKFPDSVIKEYNESVARPGEEFIK